MTTYAQGVWMVKPGLQPLVGPDCQAFGCLWEDGACVYCGEPQEEVECS